MKDFKKYVVSETPHDFPFTNETLFLIEAKNWVQSSTGHSYSNRTDSFNNRYVDLTDGDISRYGDITGFAITDFNADFNDNLATRMYFTFATFQSKLELLEDGYPNERMWKFYDNMQTALLNTEEITGMSGGVQSCDEYYIMTLTSYLATSAMINMITSFAIAIFVIFLVTYDLKVTALSGLALYSIISLVFAEMVVFGWEINLLESVDISIAGVIYIQPVTHTFMFTLPYVLKYL
jgi:hypothetical protein